jgi:hypothetical protein
VKVPMTAIITRIVRMTGEARTYCKPLTKLTRHLRLKRCRPQFLPSHRHQHGENGEEGKTVDEKTDGHPH